MGWVRDGLTSLVRSRSIAFPLRPEASRDSAILGDSVTLRGMQSPPEKILKPPGSSAFSGAEDMRVDIFRPEIMDDIEHGLHRAASRWLMTIATP